MRRQKFRFTYTAKQLLDATEEKIKFHQARKEHWEKTAKEAEQKLRDEGIDFRAVAEYGGTYTLSNKIQKFEPIFDNALYKNFQEAQAKVKEHLERVLEYQPFRAGFATSDENRNFVLNADDVYFFGLDN